MDLGEIGWEDVQRGQWLLWMRWWTFGFWRHGVGLVGKIVINDYW
jgi:hypothetical protein